MSFRSRSRATQPLGSSRRRSLSSSSRPTTATGTSAYNYNGSSYNSAARPLSTSNSYYQSPYASIYSSRDNLYSTAAGNRNGYYSNANGVGGGGGGTSTSGGYESRYSSNPYNSDRYISPYSSSYDNGITTASLSFNMGASKPSSSSSFKGSNSYLNKSTTGASGARSSASLLKTKSLSGSNSSLNNAYSTAPKSMSPAGVAAIVSRSSSLREQERKSRTRTRSRSAAQRSLSASSEKSEGYESGSERTSRSRVSSGTNTTTTSAEESKSRDRPENGDAIDYKALWEAVKLENDKLKQQLKKKDDEVVQTRAALERVANATSKNSLSEIEKRERRAMERKLSEMEEELKQLEVYKTENQRLKEENGALIRVISKLSK